jgi:2'-hydroxyisoflavone reductase
MAGTWRVAADRAAAAGLRCRPVAETVADVWAWLRDGGEGRLPDWLAEVRPAEMPAAREGELLRLAP